MNVEELTSLFEETFPFWNKLDPIDKETMCRTAHQVQFKKGSLKIIPLGGLEQIGMNITAFEFEDSIIVVDCGLAFPADDMLGIDLVIPDITYLVEN